MAELYWIRTREMTDIFSQGYVGISTVSAKSRWASHKASSKLEEKKHLPIYRAMNKYGVDNLVMEVIVVGPDDYIIDLEKKIRPESGTGWNCAIGGQATGAGRIHSQESRDKRSVAMKGRKASDETRKKMSEASKGVPKSPEHKIKCGQANLGKKRDEAVKKAHSEKMKGLIKITEEGRKKLSEHHKNLKPWQRSRSKLDLWANAIDAFNFSKSSTFSQRYLARRYELKDCSVSAIYQLLKAGWNPNEDKAYLAWLEEYKTKQGGLDGT